MKLPRTVGPAVAASLLATTVAALAEIAERLRTARPRTRVRQTELRMRRSTLPPHSGTPRTSMIGRLCRDEKMDCNSDDQ
jgi:hypothetical protein